MILDLIITLLLAAAVFRGHEIGLVRQVLSAGGFIGGLFIGAALQSRVIPQDATESSRALIALLLTIACALVVMSIGEVLGMKLKRRLQPIMHLNRADSAGGSLAGGASILIAVWLLAPSLSSLPSSGLKQSIEQSRIVNFVQGTLPSAPQFIASLDKVINPNGFPDVFGDLERTPLDDGAPLPQLGNLQAAVEKARPSVVKLEGRGCGGIVDGSGYVAADGIVMTNAHVIAGVNRPTVLDANGRHPATPIWFDSDLDIAVLRVSGLAGSPLPSGATRVAASTPSAVLGYPGGGSFRASAATVLDQFTANGRDIYGRDRTNRNIYELKADIIPGNSGGPLINAEGAVIGVIFAESTNYEQIGYALSMEAVNSGLEQARQQNQPVDTGVCAE